MAIFTNPSSFRLRSELFPSTNFASQSATAMSSRDVFFGVLSKSGKAHTSHPDFWHLVLLVFEAVLEVVCVSLPGYIVARQGMFDAEAQKFVANLNVQLFTPCLIFTKLASQLTADKLVELAIIPLIFVVQTMVSFLCALAVSRLFGFKKRPRNFVIAMAVFGNSNSLPISLVLSLSKTISGLHWDRIPGDNDNEVGARGILYLLIFQQLGQLVRWTWGYNVLLAPAHTYSDEDEGRTSTLERGDYQDGPEDEQQNLLDFSEEDSEDDYSAESSNGHTQPYSDYESGTHTPVATRKKYASSANSASSEAPHQPPAVFPTPTNGNNANGVVTPHPHEEPVPKGPLTRMKRAIGNFFFRVRRSVALALGRGFSKLPQSVQKVLSKLYAGIARFMAGLWAFMNPPLWAMLVAIIVASIPKLQHLFFAPGTFVSNSVTRAISQSGGVAVPLILVVLGANLARDTLPKESLASSEDPKEERKLLIASLISRMLLPTLLMAPILAVTAKFVPVSILDDPIFVIVCFLLTGAPSALQLAQICQLNNIYVSTMSGILFQSYVVWILPSTLVLVTVALEVVEWAAASS